MQSKEADPHDIFAIETILATRADRAPPLAHDPHGQPAGPHLNIAPEISVGSPIPQIEPGFRLDDARASQVAIIPADDIKVEKPTVKPPGRWARPVVMALLGLIGAIGAAGWQHYGDHAREHIKTMAANWTPAFVTAALIPAEKSAAADSPAAPDDGQAEAQAAVPAPVEQAATAAAPAPETTQLQSMASDLAAMGQQVEELKATIAQLKAGQAQLTRDLAKSQEAKATETKPAQPRIANAAPAGSPMAASAALPRPVAAAPPPRKPKPAPAQAAYVPPPPPVQLQSAPPQALADDGAPLVRPPMPLR
jgi:hypothetical protein